ncbi:enoyl-CoA hydratase [Gordonia sp. TBRC 11910]|uniref:Enoyl-CoA hydratase n=1 Tax=Gordonia asplenii TaxID=2725283 RepID=A0A848KYF3_9ACTN|nr:enoyl-CoA hydratase-related protein [Gordonia asplenii]NMO01241.1 enoyl-CoA hydratase [Gordonia asplenii]
MSTPPDVVDGVAISVTDDGIARIAISRPERMNALDGIASARIVAALREWADDDAIRVVVIDGAGGAFCTGADVVGIASTSLSQPEGLTDEQARDIIGGGTELARAVRAVRAPVIASVDGPAAGIGASLAVAADLVYATQRSYFLLAFINIGLMPDGGASMLFAAALGRARANEMALLGEKLSATDAFDAGLINRVVDDRAELDDLVTTVAGKLAKRSPQAVRLTKSALDAHTLAGLSAALDRELSGQATLLLTDEFQAAIAAFAGKSKR